MIHIGIIGGGFVGGATSLLSSAHVNTIVYDLDPKKCKPEGTTFDDILKTEGVFIAVPTPFTSSQEEYGKCNTKIVDIVIKQLKDANYKGYIIVRSTVPVGYCESRNVHFMPEFLTEKNWAEDFMNCKLWIFGISSAISREDAIKIKEWFSTLLNISNVTHKRCEFVSTKEGELIKYFRNCFLAVKVGFSNEMYQFANSLDIDYENVRKLACEDERVGHSHTIVPFNGRTGIRQKCLPKEIASFEYQCKQRNIRSDIISGTIKRNDELDCPERDWLEDY